MSTGPAFATKFSFNDCQFSWPTFCCRNQNEMSGAVEPRPLNAPCSLRRAWTSPCSTCTGWALITTTHTWECYWFISKDERFLTFLYQCVLVVRKKCLVPSEIQSFLSNDLIFCFSCVISLRHITWTNKWSQSKNWQTGWPTCGAWELHRTAWRNTCLTNTPLAKKAAKHNVIKSLLCAYIWILLSQYEAICMTPASHLKPNIY